MRATAQDPLAAQLMGINVDRVIGVTFALGGALGGAAAVIYGLYINTVSYQMGFTNGLYAFTAAVLGGIGNIPGAVLGGLDRPARRSGRPTSAGADQRVVFVILIAILVFRPAGPMVQTREKYDARATTRAGTAIIGRAGALSLLVYPSRCCFSDPDFDRHAADVHFIYAILARA
jgi:ABC-type branched-subunit amino acid transport system permease subunit